MNLQLSRAVWVILLALSFIFTACSRKPKSQKDQVSYAIGAQFGKSLRAQNLDLVDKHVAHGIEDGLKADGKLELTDEEMQNAMLKLNEDRQKEMHVLAEKNKIEADEFLSRNRVVEGMKETTSGLQYNMLSPGSGASPKGDDIVVVNYKGTLIDGKEFDSSYKRNAPAEFPLNGVIPGWTEGLKLLKKGGKAIFFVPPQLGYGDRARQNIPPNAVLIFDVELVDVKPAGKATTHAPSAPPKKK